MEIEMSSSSVMGWMSSIPVLMGAHATGVGISLWIWSRSWHRAMGMWSISWRMFLTTLLTVDIVFFNFAWPVYRPWIMDLISAWGHVPVARLAVAMTGLFMKCWIVYMAVFLAIWEMANPGVIE